MVMTIYAPVNRHKIRAIKNKKFQIDNSLFTKDKRKQSANKVIAGKTWQLHLTKDNSDDQMTKGHHNSRQARGVIWKLLAA